ncbi:MAG TPA: cysteine peptidase family C39 domain-containing protein, partial [Polyangiales bacterium]
MKRWWPARKVRFIPQLEVAECGAASLAMVLDYHGCSLPLVEVRTACAVTRDGASAARIVKAARELGLEARGVKVELADLARIPTPAILHWELNHFVVLERRTRRGAVLVDPARGRRQVSEDTLSEAFTGVALCFAPSARLPRRPRRAHSLKRYVAALARERHALLYVALCMALLQLLGLLFAASTQLVVDHVIK